jgi:hypothetical protein
MSSTTQLSPTEGLIALGMICGTLIVFAGLGIYQISRAPPQAVGQALVAEGVGAAAADVIGAAEGRSQGGRRRHKTPRGHRKRKSRRHH